METPPTEIRKKQYDDHMFYVDESQYMIILLLPSGTIGTMVHKNLRGEKVNYFPFGIRVAGSESVSKKQ